MAMHGRELSSFSQRLMSLLTEYEKIYAENKILRELLSRSSSGPISLNTVDIDMGMTTSRFDDRLTGDMERFDQHRPDMDRQTSPMSDQHPSVRFSNIQALEMGAAHPHSKDVTASTHENKEMARPGEYESGRMVSRQKSNGSFPSEGSMVTKQGSEGGIGRFPSGPIKIRRRISSSSLMVPDDLGKIRKCAYKIVKHPWFETFMGIVIGLNVSYMGWAADHAAEERQVVFSMKMVELIFCLFFTGELIIRLMAYGSQIVVHADRLWTLFDAFLVIQSIYEVFCFLISNIRSETGGLSSMRTMRLMKILKMLRVIRLMRSMFELRIILTSIIGSMRSMFWTLVLILGVMYMFALVFVQAFAAYLQEDNVQAELVAKLRENWGGIVPAMVSLFACSTGGSDWRAIADSLGELGSGFFGAFCMYIAFFTFVILNTITSLFVEVTLSNSQKDYQISIQAELENKDAVSAKLRDFFIEVDDSGDGLISLEEFCNHLQDPRMHAFLACMGLDISDAKHFFRLVSHEGTTPIDVDTFVTSCIRMRGQARAVDMQELLAGQSRFRKDVDSRMRRIEHDLFNALHPDEPRPARIQLRRSQTCLSALTIDETASTCPI